MHDEFANLNFITFQLSKSDNLSKHMCQNCLNLLNGCIMFREMCQQTNKKMIELSIKKGKIISLQSLLSRIGVYDNNSVVKVVHIVGNK